MPELLTFPEAILPPHFDAQVRAILRAEWPLVDDGAPPQPHDGSRPASTLMLLVEGDEVLSYLAVPSKEIEVAGIGYRASGLSSVITHHAHRGHGHGHTIVTAAREHIASSGADIGIFTCDHPLAPFYVQCGWLEMKQTRVIGGTRQKPFPADPREKTTLMDFFSDKARWHRPDLERASVYLDLTEGDLW